MVAKKKTKKTVKKKKVAKQVFTAEQEQLLTMQLTRLSMGNLKLNNRLKIAEDKVTNVEETLSAFIKGKNEKGFFGRLFS